jgi:hypothetical protein
VPPRLRKKATAELAAPRSLAATVFLHGQDEILHRHADADAQDEREGTEQHHVGLVVDRVLLP